MTQIISQAKVPTSQPVPYMRQLCKHFGHQHDASFGDHRGCIQFEFERCELHTREDRLELAVSAADAESHGRMEQVIGSHLERFGKGDGLAVAWTSER